MIIGKIHSNAIENRMLIEDVRIDFSGDELFKVTFSYWVSDRKKHDAFSGAFPLS